MDSPSSYSAFYELYLACTQADKNTHLLNVAKKGNFDLIQILINVGASLEARDSVGLTPFLCAVKSKDHISIAILLSHCPHSLFDTDQNGDNALALTLWHDNENTFRFLIEAYGDYMSSDMFDVALIAATINDNVEAVQLLIDTKKIDINKKNRHGDTPLICAVMFEKTKIIERLLANCADVTLKNEKGETILELAINTKNMAVCDLIMKSRRSIPSIYPDLSPFFCQKTADEEMEEATMTNSFATLSLSAPLIFLTPSAPPLEDLFVATQQGTKRKALCYLSERGREMKKCKKEEPMNEEQNQIFKWR